MPETEPSRGAARASEPTEGPSLTFDLAEQIASLRQEPYWQSGRNSKTIVKYPDFRVVLTALQASTTRAASCRRARLEYAFRRNSTWWRCSSSSLTWKRYSYLHGPSRHGLWAGPLSGKRGYLLATSPQTCCI